VVLSLSWEANSRSANQEIPHLLWNPKVHYHVHNNLPLVSILSQLHLVHTFSPYFPKIHSDVILPSTPRSSECSLPFRLSDQILYAFLISPTHATRPAHSTLLDLLTLIIIGETYKLWSSSLYSLLQTPTTSSLLPYFYFNTPLLRLGLASGLFLPFRFSD